MFPDDMGGAKIAPTAPNMAPPPPMAPPQPAPQAAPPPPPPRMAAQPAPITVPPPMNMALPGGADRLPGLGGYRSPSSQFDPSYIFLHDSGGRVAPGNNPYNALVDPLSGRVEYRNPSDPYGTSSAHAGRGANQDSVSISLGGEVGQQPTPIGLASLQREFDKARAQNPNAVGVGHGQAVDLYKRGAFPYPSTNDPRGRDVTEATWRQDLTGPILAPTPSQARELAANTPSAPVPMSQRSITASMMPSVMPRSPAPYAGDVPRPSVAQPGASSPPYNPPSIYGASPEPGGILESYTQGSPIYSQYGMGPNELPDGRFWKARDVQTKVPMNPAWGTAGPQVSESPVYRDPGSDSLTGMPDVNRPEPTTQVASADPPRDDYNTTVPPPPQSTSKDKPDWEKRGKSFAALTKAMGDAFEKGKPKLDTAPIPSKPRIATAAPQPRNLNILGQRYGSWRV